MVFCLDLCRLFTFWSFFFFFWRGTLLFFFGFLGFQLRPGVGGLWFCTLGLAVLPKSISRINIARLSPY